MIRTMNVNTQSVNFKADATLLKFVQVKLDKLKKFHEKIVDAEVFLKVQQTSAKENKITEVKLNVPNSSLVVKKESKTFEEGISLAVDSLKRQLEKVKDKSLV